MKKEENSEFILKCYKFANDDFKVLYDLISYKNISSKSLKYFLETRKVSKKFQEQLFEIERKKDELRNNIKNFEVIDNVIDLDSKGYYSNIFLNLKKVQKEFKNKESMPFWEILFNISIAGKIKNNSWIQKEIDNFLKLDSNYTIFSFNKNWLTNESDEKNVYKVINKSLNSVQSKLSNKNITRVYNSKVFSFKDEKVQSFKEHPWTLEEIRDFISKRDTITNYIGYWKSVIGTRVSRTELFKYFENTMNTIYFLEFGKFDLWLLQYYFPNDDYRRSLIKKQIQLFAKSNEPYVRWILLKLAENSTIKTWLAEVDDKFTKPLFLLKRKFYKDLLSSGHASEFAIYNLMKLGDQDVRYLAWLSL